MFLKMNTRHQVHKSVKKCNYWGRFSKRNGQEGQTASACQGGRSASPCQILWKLVKPRLRYGNFSIFQDGGRRHLGFFKFEIFNSWTAQDGRNALPCQIGSKSVKPLPRYHHFFLFFQDGGRPPSWISYVCVWTTHEGHLVDFIAV